MSHVQHTYAAGRGLFLSLYRPSVMTGSLAIAIRGWVPIAAGPDHGE